MKKLLVLSLVLMFASCVSKKKYDDLEAKYYAALQEAIQKDDMNQQNLADFELKKSELEREIQTLKNEIDNQKSIVSDCESNLNNLQTDFDDLAQKSSKDLAINAKKNKQLLKELEDSRALLTEKENLLRNKISRVKELETLLNQQKQQLNQLKTSITNALKNFSGKGISVNQRNGRIYVSMDNKLLFASGQWQVQQNGVNALNNLSDVLKQQKDIAILIEGHTDNVPYAPKEQIKDNWDLSVMRATAITKILQSKGVSPKQMIAGGRSEYLPLESNKEAEGRAKNRRVEIILTPNLDKINQLLNNI